MTGHDPYQGLTELPSFTLTSDDVADSGALGAAQYASDLGGRDVSPQLAWSGFPDGTRSFAVTVYDPDAPTASGFWHWAAFDLPVATTELVAGAGTPGRGLIPDGAVTLRNELGERGYTGANPPDGEHRYFLVVHAVGDEHLEVAPDATPAILGFQLNFHAIGRAILVATASPDAAPAH